jgi:hypothetical protein
MLAYGTTTSQAIERMNVYADCLLRLIAITPSKQSAMPFEQVEKICLDYTASGLKTMAAISNKPFRFIYTSGAKVNRDQTVKPWIMADYGVLRVSPSLFFFSAKLL